LTTTRRGTFSPARTLLHTDFNPLNVPIRDGTAWIIDWAWPTRGAAFIDPACFLLRLMLGGHTTAQAESWAAQCDSWAAASDKAIDTFALACTRMYAEIAHEDPQPWKQRLAAAARDWARHRSQRQGCSVSDGIMMLAILGFEVRNLRDLPPR
jgi:Ser/Thr protein kinase RdoA (MazF antagonist)